MDLAKLDMEKMADQGAIMEVLHPATKEVLKSQDGSPVTISVYGTDSKIFQDAVKARATRQLRRRDKVSIDDTINNTIEMLASCIFDWNGIEENGQVLECNSENKFAVLKKYAWLRQQIDEFMSDRENFYKA